MSFLAPNPRPQVTYTSKPQAAGGPYRSLPGRIVFPGQRPTQSIQVGRRAFVVAFAAALAALAWNQPPWCTHTATLFVCSALLISADAAAPCPTSTAAGLSLPLVVQPPNVLVNEVAYKTLGFLPGSVRQEGEITPISSDTFEVGRVGGSRVCRQCRRPQATCSRGTTRCVCAADLVY